MCSTRSNSSDDETLKFSRDSPTVWPEFPRRFRSSSLHEEEERKRLGRQSSLPVDFKNRARVILSPQASAGGHAFAFDNPLDEIELRRPRKPFIHSISCDDNVIQEESVDIRQELLSPHSKFNLPVDKAEAFKDTAKPRAGPIESIAEEEEGQLDVQIPHDVYLNKLAAEFLHEGQKNIHYHIIAESIEEEDEADEFTFYHKEFLNRLEKGDIQFKKRNTLIRVINDSIEEEDEEIEEVKLKQEDFLEKLARSTSGLQIIAEEPENPESPDPFTTKFSTHAPPAPPSADH